ncbi:MAG TPA: hypothetical protein VIJ12_01445 [Candidatus Baltobacteraceae bacterium]
MQHQAPGSLSWTEVLSSLRGASGERVLLRDGKVTASAGAVRSRPAARGAELCFFSDEDALTRGALVERLDVLAKSAGRRFMTSARASIGDTVLLVESVADETIDDEVVAVIQTRRPKLGYNQSQQIGASSTLRSKRIKTGS